MAAMQHKGIRVAFIHHVIQRGGSERVSLITDQRFSQWGIESHFITNKYNDKEFLLPKDTMPKLFYFPIEKIFTQIKINHFYKHTSDSRKVPYKEA